MFRLFFQRERERESVSLEWSTAMNVVKNTLANNPQ